MKKLVITHLLLNLYLLVLVQPALPVLEYLLNYDYIVNELCENRDKPILTCNGLCYLGDQVEKQLDLDSNQQKPLPPKFDTEKFISLKVSTSKDIAVIIELTSSSPETVNPLEEENFSNSLWRPPIV